MIMVHATVQKFRTARHNTSLFSVVSILLSALLTVPALIYLLKSPAGSTLFRGSRKMSSPGDKPRILVTGGAGYIGSHTIVELVNSGFPVVIVDSLINSSEESVRRVRKLVKHPDWIDFVKADMLDAPALAAVFAKYEISSVIHFAALKAVGESVAKPLEYYRNNIGGLLNLLAAMRAADVRNIVFSSSATVYGSGTPPFKETSPTGAGITNPYGMTKHMAEIILRDFQAAHADNVVVLLRYFNPVGAHASGTIGEDPAGIPNNLMPFIQRVATGRLPKLMIYGDDYETEDGTGLRDYIHVVDLAMGHVKALEWIAAQPKGVVEVFNLGTGKPQSVLQVVAAFKKASGRDIPYEVAPRRPGDVAASFAIPTKAKEILGWEAQLGLERMCEDSWRWVSMNPKGYQTA